jgi:hypothetical protein
MKFYSYVGNCVYGFDEDGESLLPIFRDVSEFACHNEDAEKIDEVEFYKHIQKNLIVDGILNGNEVEYLKYREIDVYVIYDIDDDIHYFFS